MKGTPESEKRERTRQIRTTPAGYDKKARFCYFTKPAGKTQPYSPAFWALPEKNRILD
jgi:hypothetical protein